MKHFLALALALAACGKSDGESSSAKANDGTGSATGGGTASGTAAPIAHAASRGPEHPVYSLVDNRLAAHLERNGGILLVGGSAGFAKYVRFGNTNKIKTPIWQLRQTEGDQKVAKLSGASGGVTVPLTADEIGASPVVRVRAYSATPRAVTLKVNDGAGINGQLNPGWSVAELPVPANQLKEGENNLLLFVKGSGLSVDWIQVGGAAPGDKPDDFYDPGSKSLAIPSGGAMTWYVFAPDKGKVTADLDDGACSVDVVATADGGQQVKGSLTGAGSAVDLDALSGKPMRLTLSAKGCPVAHLANAALVVPGDAPAKVQRGAPPKYVVLLIMDALRADKVKIFNPDARPETPTWDKLADDSAVFLQNYVQGNESRVSHASIWTAMYPIKHNFISDSAILDHKFVTVEEVAKDGGMYAAGASANGFIDPKRWGFGDKWDVFNNHIHDETGLRGEDILEDGWGKVGAKKEPWFLYLGFVDTHVTWRPHQPWLDKYDPGYSGRFEKGFGGQDAADAATGKSTLTDREKKHCIALYDSDVSYQDDVLRQLIEKLQQAGIYDQTMLIVTADHGDEQWEEGRVGHGGSNLETLIHVPLLIHYPPLMVPGKYTEGVESVDLVPTIADAIGVNADPEWQGESLIPLTEGVGRGYPRLSFNSMYEDQHAGRIGAWKARVHGGNPPVIEDLASDPTEKKDLYGEGDAASAARALLDPIWILRSYNLQWRKAQWGNVANVTSRFAADMGE